MKILLSLETEESLDIFPYLAKQVEDYREILKKAGL